MGPSFQAFLLYLAALSWVRHHLVLTMTTEEKAKTSGLLGAHVMATMLQQRQERMQWYKNELLTMATDLGHRLLPAFNTTSGLPYPRVNLRYGVLNPLSRTGTESNTCTACAGTMILEFAALSRLSGEPVFEGHARRALDVLWEKRQRGSDLVGTVINIHNGDWAFTTEFRVHWGQHPLRPEFAESTYFLYKATGDPYYLQVGRSIVDSLNQHARVPCGFAAVQDVRTGRHEDRMDSFFLAEMFKYLYLLFSEKEQLLFDIDDYIFSTEAHLLPVTLSTMHPACQGNASAVHPTAEEDLFTHSCPSTQTLFPNNPAFAKTIRDRYKYLLGAGGVYHTTPVREFELPLHDTGMEPVEFLKSMGISLSSVGALSGGQPDSQKGVYRLKLIAELTHTPEEEVIEPLAVQIISPPFLGRVVLTAGPAKFGMDLTKNDHGVKGSVVKSAPYTACSAITNAEELRGRIALAVRGECMFASKARRLQEAGVAGVIFIDQGTDSSSEGTPLFQMVGDGGSTSEISVPLVFLFSKEGQVLLDALEEHSSVEDSQKGLYRLKLIAELTHTPEEEVIEPLAVQIISPPFLGRVVLTAGPAKFGMDLTKNEHGVKGSVVKSAPYTACSAITNAEELRGRIALAVRGECMFASKARRLQEAGGGGVIFIDQGTDSSSEGTPLFQMVGDGGSTSEISVPLVFLFSKEGQVLLDALEEHSSVEVLLLPRNKQLGQDIKKKDRPLVMNVNVRLADEWDLQAGSSGQLGGGIATAELVLEPEEQGEESQGLGSSSTASDLSTGAQAEPSDSQQPCAQPEP
ncbi:UNVERIFIED_CONTAM: hypothetical protein FKN15_076430 [Acipenser sinensis]